MQRFNTIVAEKRPSTSQQRATILFSRKKAVQRIAHVTVQKGLIAQSASSRKKVCFFDRKMLDMSTHGIHFAELPRKFESRTNHSALESTNKRMTD